MGGIIVIGKVAGVKKAFELLRWYQFSDAKLADPTAVKHLEFLKGYIWAKWNVKVRVGKAA